MNKLRGSITVVSELLAMVAFGIFAFLYIRRLNDEYDGKLAMWLRSGWQRVWSLGNRLLDGPRAAAFRSWSQRFWKEVE